MQLSEHFSLEEITRTSTGLPNEAPPRATDRLAELCASILEPVRAKWGPIRIDSGYRRREVNEKVGGAPGSQHCLGEAADIVPLEAGMDEVFDWIVRGSGLCFGQCIREDKGSRWIHVSLPRTGRPNNEALVYDGRGYRPYAG